MPDGARPARGSDVPSGASPMDALNADEVQSYLHAPEFGRRLHWVRFRSFAGAGARGQVAPEAAASALSCGPASRPEATRPRLQPVLRPNYARHHPNVLGKAMRRG